MGRREFTTHDGREIREHWRAGDSVRVLERHRGGDRHSLRKYVALAEATGYHPAIPGSPAWRGRHSIPQRFRSGSRGRAKRCSPRTRTELWRG